MKLKTDTVYNVNHSRKGKFQLRVIEDYGDFVDGTIVTGKTKTLLPENSREAGETVQIRKSLATFTEA